MWLFYSLRVIHCEGFGNCNGCGTLLMLGFDMNSGHITEKTAICNKHIIVPVFNVGFIDVLVTFLDREQYTSMR